MPTVDLEKLKKEEAKNQDNAPLIEAVKVGDKTLFKGREIEEYFDDYVECITKNQEAARQKHLKSLGLNEHGQSPEQVKRANKVRELIKDKTDLLAEIAEIDQEIALVNQGKARSESKSAEKPEEKRAPRGKKKRR